MSLEFLIPFLFIYVFLWIGFYIFQRKNYYSKFSENFSYRNTFTFETHNFINGSNIIVRIGFIFGSILSFVPFLVYFSTKEINYTLHVQMLIAGVFLLVSAFLKIMLFFTKTLNIKLFIFEYVFRMLTFIGAIILMISGISISIKENLTLYRENSTVLWAFCILFILLLFVNISGLFRRKFYNWYNFETNEEGVIKKPKTILIALYEWIFDLSEIVFVISVSIFMYFC